LLSYRHYQTPLNPTSVRLTAKNNLSATIEHSLTTKILLASYQLRLAAQKFTQQWGNTGLPVTLDGAQTGVLAKGFLDSLTRESFSFKEAGLLQNGRGLFDIHQKKINTSPLPFPEIR
jgi:hypothetical protein